MSNRAFWSFLFAGLVMLITTASAIVVSEGWPSRIDASVVAIDREREPVIPYLACQTLTPSDESFEHECRLGQESAPARVAVWGDSHALAWAPAVDEALVAIGVGGRLLTHSACPPLVGVVDPLPATCPGFNDEVLSYLEHEDSPQVVLFIASWIAYSYESSRTWLKDRDGLEGNPDVFAKALDVAVTRLVDSGKQVIIVGPTPGAPFDVPLESARAVAFGFEKPVGYEAGEFLRRSRNFASVGRELSERLGVALLFPDALLCDDAYCRYTVGNAVLYRDSHHLSAFGAKSMVGLLKAAFSGSVGTENGGVE